LYGSSESASAQRRQKVIVKRASIIYARKYDFENVGR